MRYLKYWTILLAFSIIASMFVVPSHSSPPEPDPVPWVNFSEWMDQWEKDNMDPLEKDVNDEYKRFSGLVGDYRSAILDVGSNVFSGVSGLVQDNWIAMLMSVQGVSRSVATNIAKSESLRTSVERSSDLHATYWRRYHSRYDEHGTVTEGTVAAQVILEIAQHGGIVVSASTMMEAYWKYEFIVRDYNAQVDAWNAYRPSQAKQKAFTTVPSKAEFDKFNCFGGCGYEHDLLDYARDTHQLDCGTGENVDEVVQRTYGHYRNDNDVKRELKVRTVAQGCGRPYYTCNTSDKATHEIQTCVKWVYQRGDYYGAQLSKSRCGISFRKCLLHTFDHHVDVPGESVHSTDPSAGGDGTAQTPSTPETAMHACGIHATTVSGSHSTITPPCGDSAHAGYACQISSDHNTAMSGWSGPFYECQPYTNYPCGHTDPTANVAYHAYASCGISGHYVCDSLTHVEEQCSNTSNGVRCTYQFWRCLHPSVPSYGPSHTCVYPVSCGRSACTQTVSSSTQHSATCASGHSYWTCKSSDVNLHITRTCRYSECGKSWERCSTVGGTPICDKPWRKQNGLRCWQIY